MKTLSIHEAMAKPKKIFIDTRSPAEYEQGHIPGAYNFPILDNEERAVVGTLYKQNGAIIARSKGLEFVSSRLADLIGKIQKLNCNNPQDDLILYCWRGGMRSRSVVTVLELMGVSSAQLEGGYKAYRSYVQKKLNDFSIQPCLYVLCGSTGCGKTRILELLNQRNHPVIDLEKLANHRGSAFGQVGLGKPSTAQNFDAELLQCLENYNQKSHIFVECESKRVGNVYLPESLYSSMKIARKILIRVSKQIRIQRLIEDYTQHIEEDSAEIRRSIDSLHNKIGKKKTALAIQELSAGNFIAVAELLLDGYYDPLYGYETATDEQYELVVNADDLLKATEVIEQYVDRGAKEGPRIGHGREFAGH